MRGKCTQILFYVRKVVTHYAGSDWQVGHCQGEAIVLLIRPNVNKILREIIGWGRLATLPISQRISGILADTVLSIVDLTGGSDDDTQLKELSKIDVDSSSARRAFGRSHESVLGQ